MVSKSTLHRISAIRDRRRAIVGLTLRVGRHVPTAADPLQDVVARICPASLLLLGPPGVGRTTVLREVARRLADAGRRVVIVDSATKSRSGSVATRVLLHDEYAAPKVGNSTTSRSGSGTHLETRRIIADEISTRQERRCAHDCTARRCVGCDGARRKSAIATEESRTARARWRRAGRHC